MGEWPIASLREAGIALIDCVHKTPPAVKNGYPYVAIPQMKDGRIDFKDARRIRYEDFFEWTRKDCRVKSSYCISWVFASNTGFLLVRK